MSKKNKSGPYGYYGGVSNENHYSPDYEPQPARMLFTSKDKQLLRDAESPAAFVEANSSNILLRFKTDSQPNNLETFTITTSGQPEDIIKYTSNRNEIILDDVAGFGIVDNKQNIIGGGTF